MNDGDPNAPQRGRAQIPGSPGGFGGPAGGIPFGGMPMADGSGASSGRARVGRASVGGAGSGAAGRASVGGAAGSAGRARVPVQSGGAAGRATVGRASVSAGAADDVIENRGSSGRPAKGSPPSGAAAARAKRARRRNLILGAFALFIMIAGGTVVGGTFFYDDVALPSDLPQRAQSTTIYYSDNKTEMGKIGNQNRTIIPSDQIPKQVKNAVVATENKTFYTDRGISYTGIMRAAWNNMTGGERQGASTITQQYAREIAELKGITYSRKLREAVLAMKLNDTYDKDKILTAYLNTVYFGRNSYGVEAASQAYFGKNAKQLDVAEGMALAAMIKNPAGGPNGLSYYDGTVQPEQALARFESVKPNMVEMKFITPEQAATLKYPAIKKYDPADPAVAAQGGLDRPTGNVLHNVIDELTHMTDAKGNPMFADLEAGGYRIVTTIDKAMQDQAEKYASGQLKDSPLASAKAGAIPGVPPEQNKVVAALVSVEPYSGRVKAYYGGPNGAEQDVAGVWRDKILSADKKDDFAGFGRHAPASSFKIYTLGAALREGISINSYWNAPATKKYDGEPGEIRNAEGNGKCGAGQTCRLWEATAQSLNVPFYDLTKQIGPSKVLEFARDAGIRYIWDDNAKRFELNPTGSIKDPLNDAHVGIGQFRVTVLDHANGVASIAARGARAQAHFVSQVYKGSASVHKEAIGPAQIRGFTQQMADDETYALQKVLSSTNPGLQLTGQRAAAAKTGTWQATEGTNDTKNNGNSNAWMVGYVAPDLTKKPQQFYGLATAVWMGALKGDSVPITIGRSPLFGSSGPGKIWKGYMDAVTTSMPKTKFADPKFVGDDTLGNAQPPVVPAPVDPNAGQPGGICIPPFCQPGQPGQPPAQPPAQPGLVPGNGNGNGRGNGGQGGGGPAPGTPAVFPSRRN
jgi:membrane peptidoglycan carboxypeptidase